MPSPTPNPPAVAVPVQGSSAGTARVAELDGLRGWAALCVVCYHVVWQIFGVAVPGFRNVATAFILDGPLAVAVFFVLSGDALSAATLSSREPVGLWRLLLRRYVRLSVPICAVCLVVGLLKVAGCVHNADAARIVHQGAYFGDWLPVTPTLTQTLTYAFASVFLDGGVVNIDRFLWTMPIEAVGSCCVFATAVCARWMKQPIVLVVALFEVALCMQAYYVACFFAGMSFAMLRSGGTLGAIRARRSAPAWSGLAIGVLVITESTLHLTSRPEATPLLADVLVFCVLCNEPLCRAFRSRGSQWLGRVSFSLYLVQFPVLVSATSYAIVVAESAGHLLAGGIFTIAVGSIALSLAAAVMFEPVDRLAIRLARRATSPSGRVGRSATPAALSVLAPR